MPAIDEQGTTPALTDLAPRRHPIRLLRHLAAGAKVAIARLRFLAIFVVVFAVIGGWETITVYWAKLTTSSTSDEVISSDTEYFCPMDPGVISDWPSKCPICHMSLVRRKRGDASPLPDGVVARMQFTPYRLYLGGIGVTPVEYRPLAREFEVPGRFTAVHDEGGCQVKASAFAREVAWLELGQTVEVLVIRDSGAGPLPGVLREVPEILGDSSKPLLLVVDVETHDSHARPGEPVRVRFRCPAERLDLFRDLPSQPPALRDGEPQRVYHCMNHPEVVQDKAGTCPQDQVPLMAQRLQDNQRVRWWCPMHPEVTADLPGSSCEPCGGMILVPRVVSYRLPGTVLSVPASAVIDDGTKALAYVDRGAGMFDAKVLTFGPRCGDSFPVVAGLEPGDRVVTQGAFLVDAETRLNPSLAASYFGAGNTSPGRETAVRETKRVPAEADDAWLNGLAAADRPRALRQKTCPVTGKALGSMGVPARLEVRGAVVLVCCAGCTSAVETNPERYLGGPSGGGAAGEERP